MTGGVSGKLRFTERQRQAIDTLGGSVTVTAAAGSGKTAVLAERCAHLVCDLPPGQRCGIDELLVVTFTEAAAAEMKSRILQAIRKRGAARPRDAYLRTQAALVDTAQISTLHSFCLWMLRRWFNEAELDPAAAVLEAEEARLLRQETVEALCNDLYESGKPLGRAFVRLVDEYGIGNDSIIASMVTQLDDLLRSFPDPEAWGARALAALGSKSDDTVAAFNEIIRTELRQQETHVRSIVSLIEQKYAIGALYGQKLAEYAEDLQRWSGMADLDEVSREVTAYKLSAGSGVRVGKNAPDRDLAERDAARDLFTDVQKRLLTRRLKPVTRFGTAEMLAGLAATGPHVETLCTLVADFDRRYRQAKRTLDALDFADLERGAYDLLRDKDDPEGLSPVARDLHDRFAHVLVDEFQDINPLQAAVLNHVSRESDAARANNLFCVGDVKQSIYRFRLAEPELFSTRIEKAEACTTGESTCVRLQDNFRSTERLIDGVNLLFERLMTRQLGGVDYDDFARLRCGLTSANETEQHPIELHLLARRMDGGDDEDDGERRVDPADMSHWEVIEREACLIARRIKALRASGMTVDGRPLGWGDIAVLMRATKYNAQPLAEVLGRMGVPTQTDTGDALFEATEVQDVLALLRVLDNPQQDIPLASVLRSGVMGMSLSEDDLASIRAIDREVPFHEAFRHASRAGAGRYRVLLDRLDRWRREARRRPVAEVLWKIYQESGYLAYVGGLSQGRFRRANLLALHERARQFGGFRRQGLHRFLRFIESLEEAGQELRGAPPLGEAQDAVRIMSIHRAKGLEFPVVFVADLGHRFNFSDARGRIIFDRRGGIGLRVVDTERRVEYPSIQHLRVARSIEAGTLDEEVRVLYVALTRARQRLILVGSTDLTRAWRARNLWRGLGRQSGLGPGQPSGTPLDWIVPALATAPPDSVRWSDAPGEGGDKAASLYSVELHSEEDMRSWPLEYTPADAENRALAAAARLEPLPEDEPRRAAGFCAGEVLDRLDYPYPHLAASSVRAAVGASEAKREVDPFADEHQPRGQPHYRPTFDAPAVLADDAGSLTPRRRGALTHRVLELADFSKPVEDEVQRLVAAGTINRHEAAAVDTEAIEWFVSTPLGRRVCEAGSNYRREVRFIAAEPAPMFDPALDGTCEDRVLVRGIADGVLEGERGLEIIDFKTDAVAPEQVTERTEEYALQLGLYASAVSRIWQEPVERCWLVFLTPRRIIEVAQEQRTG